MRAWRTRRGAGGAEPRRTLGTVFLAALAMVFFAGCAGSPEALPRQRDEAEIRAHIDSIRDAICAKDGRGIVRFGTADWSFTGPDGKTYDRAAYLVRVEKLFAQIEAVESLDTQVDRLDLRGDAADVEITQTMVRRERIPPGDVVQRVWLHYREHHRWVRGADGWRVRSVEFLGAPERKVLPATGE